MQSRDTSTPQRVDRGVALQAALEGRNPQELKELLSFWDGHGSPPDGKDRLVGELHRRMGSEKSVRKRTKFLSKKLVDLLKFFLRGEGYRANLDHVTRSKAFAYLSPFELKAAVNALTKRGFLFASATANGGANGTKSAEAYLVPCELGDVLHTFIWDDDRTVEETFNLRGLLSRLVDRKELGALLAEQIGAGASAANHEEAARLLAAPEAVAARLARIDDEKQRELLRIVTGTYGGFAPRSMLEKKHKGLGRWNRKALQEVLEAQLIGTVRHVSLGEYGIHHFEDAVIIFEEVVDAVRVGLGDEPGAPEAARGLGVDFISDVSAFLSFVEHNTIKLTLSGKVYRTAVRKLEDTFILTRTSEFEGPWLFQYLFDFCQSQSMIERGKDRSIVPTVKGKSWDRTPLEKKLSRLLTFATGHWTKSVEPFHGKRLIELYLDRLRELPVGRWADINAPAFAARNRYLANLDRFGVRDEFQSKYQFAQQSGMRDPHQIAQALTNWTRERLYLFGLVDLGDRDGKAALMRLTALGAKALGLDVPESIEGEGAPLVVNPDFEVILFPNADSYGLITELDKFAERTSSDSAYRYKLTVSSIEKAVAEGLEANQILRTLSEHSRVEVPQNVIYSIMQWAEKVKFVTQANVSLLRGRNKEVIDRVLHDKTLRAHVLERLSPTVVLLSQDLPRDQLAALLEPLGVFLERGDG